jgi:hypothetical protein
MKRMMLVCVFVVLALSLSSCAKSPHGVYTVVHPDSVYLRTDRYDFRADGTVLEHFQAKYVKPVGDFDALTEYDKKYAWRCDGTNGKVYLRLVSDDQKPEEKLVFQFDGNDLINLESDSILRDQRYVHQE